MDFKTKYSIGEPITVMKDGTKYSGKIYSLQIRMNRGELVPVVTYEADISLTVKNRKGVEVTYTANWIGREDDIL